jgi:hypothetical protein
MREIDIMYRTMYAELAQRATDDSFDFDPVTAGDDGAEAIINGDYRKGWELS